MILHTCIFPLCINLILVNLINGGKTNYSKVEPTTAWESITSWDTPIFYSTTRGPLTAYEKAQEDLKRALDGVTSWSNSSGIRDLSLLVNLPWNTPVYNVTGTLPAVRMAMDDVNARTDILPGYRLRMDFVDEMCGPGPGLNALYSRLYDPRGTQYVFLVGGGCSSYCVPSSAVTTLWNITTVTPVCSSGQLFNHAVFPRFFSIYGPDSRSAALYVALMGLFGWHKVNLIHEAIPTFSATTDRFLEITRGNSNVTVIGMDVFQDDPRSSVLNMKERDARIIFGNMYESKASKTMCEAYRAGLYGPRVLWFLTNWWPEDWWRNVPAEYQSWCTEQNILEVINGSFYVGYSLESPYPDRPTDAGGATPAQFDLRYAHFTRDYYQLDYEYYASRFYDSVWVMAMALNDTMNELKNGDYNRGLEDWKYSDREMADLITKGVQNTVFTGMTGHLSFDQNGAPELPMVLMQQLGHKKVTVGYFLKNEGKFLWVNGGIQWPDGIVPSDSTQVVALHLVVSPWIYSMICGLAGLGSIMVLGFFIFNMALRKRRVIKMSSPNINNLILLGCLFSYISIFFVVNEKTFNSGGSICLAQVVTFTLGFALSFGALFAKTWRVHVILTTSQKTAKRNVISDLRLVGFVSTLVAVDAIVLAVWHFIDPLVTVITDLTHLAVAAEGADVVALPQISTCTSRYQIYFTGTLYVIHGVLLAFGAFLAWETKSIKVEALNDSKLIGICLYNVMLFSIFGVAVSYLIVDNVDAAYGFVSALTIAGTSIVACLIFIPKILAVKRGDEVVGPLTTGGGTASHSVA